VALFGYNGNSARTMAITKNEGISGVTGAPAPAGTPPMYKSRLALQLFPWAALLCP
jgi:hypothetical protein